MHRSTLVLPLAFFALSLSQFACTADLRPSTIDHLSTVTQADQAKGHQMLKQAANVHGADSLDAAETYQMEMHDQWVGFISSFVNPWPDNPIDVRLSYRLKTFDGRVDLLSGSKKGTTWGIQSWKTYVVDPNGNVKFEDNDNTELLLPALQYFIEFPFRAHKHTVAVYAGPETIRGKLYERVLVTWKNLEPTTDHDQYLAYINPESGRIEKLAYTIREIARSANGVMHFGDFREINGVQIPFTFSTTFSVEDDPEDFVRRIQVKSFTFDSIQREAFFVNPSLKTNGVTKPRTQ